MTYLNTNIDKTILVTGASRGIGKAIALRLAREGYRLAIHCRSQHQALKTVADDIEALGSQAVMLQFDIANRVEARQCLEQYIAEYGVPYGIVCNAEIIHDDKPNEVIAVYYACKGDCDKHFVCWFLLV